MANLDRSVWVLGFLLLASCGLTTPAPSLPPSDHKEQQVDELQGSFVSVDGSEVDLGAAPNSIQVVMFVSETCSICRSETRGLVADRSARGVPKNALFYSIVVGSDQTGAQQFKSSLHIDWIVGIDDGDGLFRKYCPEKLTPCVLLRNPSGEATEKLIGEHSLSEWEDITGPWRF